MSDNRAEWLEGICESVNEPAYHESDSVEILEISTALLDWLEPKIRADERARIVAHLRKVVPYSTNETERDGLIDVIDVIESGEF